MSNHFSTNPYSTRSQMMFLLLSALHHRPGGHRKIEVIDIIQNNNWFDKRLEDIKPMPSSQGNEPRWITSFAFARKDCVMEGFFEDDGIEDSWQITLKGENTVSNLKEQYREGDLDVSKCYMWTSIFKELMDPKYKASEADLNRPDDVYKDYGHTRKVNKYLDMLDLL